MSFLDINNPSERAKIVQDYLSKFHKIQQRNEDERTTGFNETIEREQSFLPIIEATKQSTSAITSELRPIQEEIKKLKRNKNGPPLEEDALEHFNAMSPTKLDQYFGIRNENSELFIGIHPIVVQSNDIHIGSRIFNGTPGLWRLIMLKKPDLYTEEDLESYKQLILLTDVMQETGVEKGKPKSTVKFQFLKKLFPKEVVEFLPANIDSLSEKLNILLGEFRAGNHETRTEIVAIIDELKRRKRMTEQEYTEINNLLAKSL